MIFSLLKLAIWLAGIGALFYFALPYFHYAVNKHYWDERKTVCQETLKQCRKAIITDGWNGAKESCNWKCIEPALLIEKQ